MNPLNNPLLTKAVFSVPIAGNTTIRDNDGNWVSEGDEFRQYTVYFKTPSLQPEVNYDPGVDGHAIYLKGYLVEPKFLPPNLKLPTRVDCVRDIGQRQQKGTFEIRPSLVPAGIVEQIIGQAIEGWFLISS